MHRDPIRYPELIPPDDLSICFGGGDFLKVGQNIAQTLQEHAGLRPESRVLDVGSGAGRIAFALAQILSDKGSYHGFDNFPSGVAWCQEHYATMLPNFHFQHVDVFSSVYYPYGTIKPAAFTFPYDDNSFDLAVLNSVFTHMLPEDVTHYLQELRRVLAPDGKSFITWFLVGDDNRQAVQSLQTRPRLEYRFGLFYAQNLESVEDAVGYEESFVRKLYERCDMRVDTLLQGSWRTQQARHRQDCIVATVCKTD